MFSSSWLFINYSSYLTNAWNGDDNKSDQIGLFGASIFLTKVAQKLVTFWEWFEKGTFYVKSAVASLRATFGYFCSIILSPW